MAKDKKLKAKPRGWRFKGEDNYKRPLVSERSDSDVYYEDRKDRSDKNLRKKLATGGQAGRKTLKSGDTVQIIGRKWFDKVNGNTYHSAETYVNNDLVGRVDFQYGYGDGYVETGRKILLEKYDLPPGMEERTPLWQLRDSGIKLLTSASNVGRKKDLDKGGSMASGGVTKGGISRKEEAKSKWWDKNHKKLIEYVEDQEMMYSILEARGIDEETIQAELDGTAKHQAITLLNLFSINELNEMLKGADGGSTMASGGGVSVDRQLTQEMKDSIMYNSDIFGVGDWDESDWESGLAFTQEDFDSVVNGASTVGGLVKDLDKEFGLDSKETIEEILTGKMATGGVVKISEDDFWEKYKPQTNHIERAKQPKSIADEDLTSWGGKMYETYGEDLEYIYEMSKNPKTKKRVWTIVEGDDGNMYIIAGYHYVNRMGYFVTEKPWKTGNEEVINDDEMASGGRINLTDEERKIIDRCISNSPRKSSEAIAEDCLLKNDIEVKPSKTDQEFSENYNRKFAQVLKYIERVRGGSKEEGGSMASGGGEIKIGDEVVIIGGNQSYLGKKGNVLAVYDDSVSIEIPGTIYETIIEDGKPIYYPSLLKKSQVQKTMASGGTLRDMSAEKLDAESFAEYLKDYYEFPSSYGIDEESEYYEAIQNAYISIKDYYVMGKWNVSAVRDSHTYKEYEKLFSTVARGGEIKVKNYRNNRYYNPAPPKYFVLNILTEAMDEELDDYDEDELEVTEVNVYCFDKDGNDDPGTFEEISKEFTSELSGKTVKEAKAYIDTKYKENNDAPIDLDGDRVSYYGGPPASLYYIYEMPEYIFEGDTHETMAGGGRISGKSFWDFLNTEVSFTDLFK